jgi:hypothetical protein
MSTGLNVYDAQGRLTYSSADVTWNQVDYFYVPGYGSESRYLPALLGREVLLYQVMINPPPTDRRAVAHTLTHSNGTVTAQGGSEASYVLVLMR